MFKIITVLLAAIIFSCNCSFAGELTSKEVVNYFNEGIQQLKNGNFYEARISYQKALLINPDAAYSKFILNNIGIAFAKTGYPDMALDCLDKALKIDPNYRKAQLNLGLAYDMLPDKLKAIEYWIKIFKLNLDTNKPKNFIICSIADLSGKERLFFDPQDRNSSKFLLNDEGIIYAQHNDLIEAEEKFQAALKIDQNYKTAQLNLGLVFEKRGVLGKLKIIEYWLKVFDINLGKLKPNQFLVEEAISEGK